VRGYETIPDQPFRFVYQFETQLDVSAASGTAETNNSQSNVVKSGLTSRNTYVGLSNPDWGSILVGKTDAPYKTSTARMNPFVGEWGDYSVIMGNTGGDNRVEFGTRLDHSIWYESPEFPDPWFAGGVKATVLFSPGQNRASNSDNIAAGESDCTGGNIPGSGGSLPYACNDGGFSDAVSTSLTYNLGPLYAIAAYERHQKVNRRSDLTGEYASPPPLYYAADVADEDAAKIGLQYTFPIDLTVSGIFERLHRYVPSYLNFQNERSRTGFWLAATQLLTPRDSVSLGWARANRTPGDPGQHNTSLQLPPLGSPGDGTGGADVDNSADMLTIAYKHELGAGLLVYIDFAAVLNGPYAHYALGAGGRAITTDCHDASDATGGESSNPHCFAGSTILGTSIGLKYTF
jgi:predicted porin